MEYSILATSINNKKATLDSSIQNIETLGFDSVWRGKSYSKLTADLRKVIENVKIQKTSLEKYILALQYLDKYKNNKNRQKGYEALLNVSKNTKMASSLTTEINSLIAENNEIRKKIQSLLSEIKTISPTVELVSYSFTHSKEYIIALDKLYDSFKNNTLTKMPDTGKNSLYYYYSQDEVDQRLTQIKTTYSGREAAVNCTLTIMKMAADVGLKLDYDWGGGHAAVAKTSSVASGVDCSGFVSWAINQGATQAFAPRTTSSLKRVGEAIEYSKAKPGDILVFNDGQSGHVVLIIENDPEKELFLVTEAFGTNEGVVMLERSYSSLKKDTYQARDLSSIYNN